MSNFKTELIEKINAVLLRLSHAASKFNSSKNEVRAYRCSHDGCERGGYAKGFCHAHYKRAVSGVSLDLPIKSRRSDKNCRTCGKKLNGKGGWNLCSNHYKSERLRAIKSTVIEHFGGCCKVCKGKFPLAAFDFHHTSKKDDSVAMLMARASVVEIVEEVTKCDLVCANCHRIIHNPENIMP